HRYYVGIDGAHAQPTAHHAGHGTRWAAAYRFLWVGSRTFPHALEINRFDWKRGGAHGSVLAAQNARRASEYRHAVGVRYCLCRCPRHALLSSGVEATFPMPVCASRAHPRYSLLLAVDVFAAGGKLVSINWLVAARHCHLFRVWQASQCLGPDARSKNPRRSPPCLTVIG